LSLPKVTEQAGAANQSRKNSFGIAHRWIPRAAKHQ
jgi:hypothetical protein